MDTYVEADSAVIFRTREIYGEGSNMRSGMPVRYDDRVFHSTEVLYQLARFPGLMDFRLPNSDLTLIEDVNIPNAMTAKMKSKLYRHLTRPDWEDGVRVVVMEACLRLKLAQHWNEMSAFLALTGDKPIVEKSRKDPFWGAIPDGEGNLVGLNVLGLLWMILRAEVRNDTFECDVAGLINLWEPLTASIP